MKITLASKSKLITETGFRNYDYCINPYVGCQFGCKYCYVRFFVKDKEYDWGEFLRIREHVVTKFPKELPSIEGKRLVIGTMTDPYQPSERKFRLTRFILRSIIASDKKPSKVGIFTRSPIILDDIELLKQIPNARVHLTITPYPPDVLKKIEPIPIPPEKRFTVLRELKKAGLKIQANISPILPIVSDGFIEEFVRELADIEPDEFYVDPMQAYGEAFEAVKASLQDDSRWEEISKIVLGDYASWKEETRQKWLECWKKYGNDRVLATWLDHQRHIAMNMNNGEFLDWKRYGEDAE